MRSTIVLPAFALLSIFFAARGDGEVEKEKAGNETDRIQRLLSDHVIETKALQKAMLLPEFLAAVEGLLPKGSKITLRIDAEAFGKDLAKVNTANVSRIPNPNASLGLVLDLAIRQANQSVPVEYAIRDNAIVITRPRLAVHTRIYEVHDLVERMPRMVERMRPGKPGGNHEDANVHDDIDATDGPALLVRLLMKDIDLEEWEAVEVGNGVRLTVRAVPRRQREIAHLLELLRSQEGLAAVLNARLYEMDRAAYTKHVAPLFVKDMATGELPSIVPVDDALLTILTGQRRIGESEEEKLMPEQEAVFLSKQSVYRFDAGVIPAGKKRGTGLAGVSFRVRPSVSADRRFLTLRITQHVTQLVGIAKAAKIDVTTGKEVIVESPNRRVVTRRGTVRVPDAGAIVMPVDYTPPGKAGEDKVWVLVARPFIWVEEEERSRLEEGVETTTGTAIWRSPIPKEER